MKDNVENELECIMPNTQLSIELEVKELAIKKQESVTQGMCAFLYLERTQVFRWLWSIQISPSCSLSTTTSLQWPLTLLHMRKEGNAYAYWNSFKVRLSSILLYWFCLDRNRKYLNLTWVPVLLLCPYDVIHKSITLLLALNASS